MRKAIVMFALVMFAAIASHATTFTLTSYVDPKVKKINVIEDGGPEYPGAAYYQYTYVIPGKNGNRGIQITKSWQLVGAGPTISLTGDEYFVDIRVQRFHILTGAPVGPL